MKTLTSISQYQAIKDTQYFIFKHSSTCSISAGAHDEVELFTSKNPNFPVYKVIVQDAREVSNNIAEKTTITHQSPQIIYIKDGKPVFNISHRNITLDALQKQIS